MLAGWDGQLTVLMRKRISRHIEQCEVCGERKRRELTPALFAGAMPMAALLPGFREQVLRVLADRSPAGLAHRLTVANRAGPFGPQGFPKPISPPGAGPWHRILHHPQAVVAGAASLVMAAGAIAVGVIAGPHHGPPSAGAGGRTTHSAPPAPAARARRTAARPAAVGTASAAVAAGPAAPASAGAAPRRAASRPPPWPSGRLHAGCARQRSTRADRRDPSSPREFIVGRRAEPRHRCRSRPAARPGVGQRHRDREVHAHRQGRPGQRLLDHGRVRAGGPHQRLTLLGLAGRRRERDGSP